MTQFAFGWKRCRVCECAGARRSAGFRYLLYLQGKTLMARPFSPARLTFTGEATPVAEQVGTLLGRPFVPVLETGILAYGGIVDGNSRISWFDRAGKAPEFNTKRGGFSSLALSPDGSRVAFDQGSERSTNIWVHEFGGSTTRLTFGKSFGLSPIRFPDGERVVYFSPYTESSTASGDTQNRPLGDV